MISCSTCSVVTAAKTGPHLGPFLPLLPLIEFPVRYTVKHQSMRFSDLLALNVTVGLIPLSAMLAEILLTFNFVLMYNEKYVLLFAVASL